MTATIVINRHTGIPTGSPHTGSIKGNISGSTNRIACSDSSSDGTSNPIPIPSSGINYSWWVSTRLAVTSTGPLSGINNIKWYSDGSSFGTGMVCVGNTASSAIGYSQATGTNTSGTVLSTANYPALVGAPTDVTNFISSSPKSIFGSLGAGLTNQDFGDFMVYQLIVSPTATVGTVTPRVFTWAYDEV